MYILYIITRSSWFSSYIFGLRVKKLFLLLLNEKFSDTQQSETAHSRRLHDWEVSSYQHEIISRQLRVQCPILVQLRGGSRQRQIFCCWAYPYFCYFHKKNSHSVSFSSIVWACSTELTSLFESRVPGWGFPYNFAESNSHWVLLNSLRRKLFFPTVTKHKSVLSNRTLFFFFFLIHHSIY